MTYLLERVNIQPKSSAKSAQDAMTAEVGKEGKKMAYKVIDLFAGAGGLSLGFTQTGKFEIVAAAENNPDARRTYKRNHKLARLYSDVHTIDYEELKDACGTIDVVIGGPPCQGFSNANRQHTTMISMNNRLVKEYVRAVCELEPKAFVMENVAMLRSNVHRFMVEEADLNNPTIMGLKLAEDKLELLPKSIDFPNAVPFAQNLDNIQKYMWDEKAFKVISVLYRFRINRPKFAASVERYQKYLIKLLADIAAKEDNDWIRQQERRMAQMLIAYINDEELEFEALIQAIETPLFVQRMLGRMQELSDGSIHINRYEVENGTLIAVVQSYAVFDYINGVLSAKPYNYNIKAKVYNALDYGAPQKRERFIIVGTKSDVIYDPPKAEFTSDTFRTVYDAIADLQGVSASTQIDAPPVELPRMENLSPLAQMLRGRLLYNHVSTATREVAQARFAALKEGQNFHDLGADLKTTYSNAERTQNTIYMRLKYDEPSGTVVNVRKSMWVHPELDRAISIREAARLQTFPDTFIFEGSKDSQYQQVGNAVPPILSNAIARSLIKALDRHGIQD